MRNEDSNTGKILIGFLAGAAVGVVAGILLAPDKGEVTRKNLADASSKFKEDLNTQVQKGIEKFNSLKESAMNIAGYKDQPTANGRKSPVGEQNNSSNL